MSYVKSVPLKKLFQYTQDDDEVVLLASSNEQPEDAAATRDALGYSLPAGVQPSAILFRDSGLGDAQIIANAGTRDVEPGPGTLTAVVNGGSVVRYDGKGRGIISNIAGTGSQGTLVRADSQTVAAGLTVMAKIVPSASMARETSTESVGFSSSSSLMLARRGGIFLGCADGDKYITIYISTLANSTDDSTYQAAIGIVKPGEEIALAVRYKDVDHQQYFIQAPSLSGLGAFVGGDEWVMLGETFTDLTGQTVHPQIQSQFSGTLQYRDFMVLSDWTPSDRHTLFDYNRSDLGTHNPQINKDPVTGLVVAAWNRGPTHATSLTLKGAVQLADGSWTDAQTLLPQVTDPDYQHISALDADNGVLWLYWRATADRNLTPRTQKRAQLTINPSTGQITVGTPQTLGIDASVGYSINNPGVHLSNGRTVLPMHKPDLTASIAYTDDDGSTWTVVDLPSTTLMVEPTLVVESDGAIGCILRSYSASARWAYYARCADPIGAIATWTTPVAIKAIPQPIEGSNGTRMQYRKLDNGRILLVGNDHRSDRRAITIWEMGDNGQVLGKTPIWDWNPPDTTNALATLQYPAIVQNGDDIVMATSRQHNGTINVNMSIGIQIDSIRWVDPVAVSAGGTGKRNALPAIAPIPISYGVKLVYSTTPTPDMSAGGVFHITLTASTATLQAPASPMPWQEITVLIQQGGSGSYTMAFDSIYQFNGITPAWRTTVGEANVLKAVFNELTNKWVVTSWN